jgi:hypothetical protein
MKGTEKEERKRNSGENIERKRRTSRWETMATGIERGRTRDTAQPTRSRFSASSDGRAIPLGDPPYPGGP